MKLLIGVLTLFGIITLSWEASVDLTLQPGTSGEDVVEAVNTKIQNSHIFSDDHRFLVRAAYVESKFGTNPDTYSPIFFGGIWQVEEAAFTITQDPSFSTIFTNIQIEFGIDWTTVTWTDLEKPLYSGLAFLILIESFGIPVPDTIELQANYWKQYYNQNPILTTDQFIIDIHDLESNPICFGHMNLEIVLDGSGSIGSIDFEKAKQFVADFVSIFSLTSTKIGLIIFNNSPNVIFSLNNVLTTDEMENQILNAVYPGGSTGTDLAIDNAVLELQNTNILGTITPRIILVLTDGQSNDNTKTIISAGNAKAAGITTFAVGIGSRVNNAELISIAGEDVNHVISVSDFDSLQELIFRINSETCKVPQTPSFGQTVKDVVGVLEKRFFKYPLPSTGLTVTVSDITGKSRGFYSYTFQNPSSALNDGIISGKTFIPPNPNVTPKQSGGNGSGGSSVFMVIQGIQINTNFTLSAVQGDTLSTATFEFIRNGPVNPPVKCGGYTNAECQGACVARPRKWAHGTCNQYVCSCH